MFALDQMANLFGEKKKKRVTWVSLCLANIIQYHAESN